MNTENKYPLQGCRILYTRSKQHWLQAEPLLRQLGAQPYHLPLLDTKMQPLSAKALEQCRKADDLVFVSAQAVQHFLAQYQPVFQQNLIAIGMKTVDALTAHAQTRFLVAPPPYNSEALLRIWQPQRHKIALIAAEGGRDLLYTTLSEDNEVYRIDAYQRFNPTHAWNFEMPLPHCILLASVQTLAHFLAITPQNMLKLLQCRAVIVALSPRIMQAAVHAGFLHCISAQYADERHLISCLEQWWLLTQGDSS